MASSKGGVNWGGSGQVSFAWPLWIMAFPYTNVSPTTTSSEAGLGIFVFSLANPTLENCPAASEFSIDDVYSALPTDSIP